MCFEWKFDFYKPVKTHIRDHHVLQIQNMGVTAKKYGVSVSFCRKLTIFGKIVGLPIDFERKFEFFKNSWKLVYETVIY
jgi:hypothetical protein